MASGKKSNYRFTFGPWNISTGRDPFGPEVRKEVSFAAKLREYKKLGFDGVQLHDDDALPEHSDEIRILGEMKPNEPMDSAYLPTVGHFLALCYRTIDPARSGVLIESAHSILAGIDPSEDMAFSLWHGKLWSVHLNDQNGPKYDQDKAFGSVDLRRAFNTVWVLERAGYDGCVGLDVKAMRTTKQEDQTRHLANSKRVFERMVELVRSVDGGKIENFRAARDYEGLELYIIEFLLGSR